MSNASDEPSPAIRPEAARAIGLGLAASIVAAIAAFVLLRKPADTPPPEIAADPFLVQGRVVFLDRCASCHGASGRGDGPIAKGLTGPPVGDLTDKTWKHGDRPEQVLSVVAEGARNSSMPGWGRVLAADNVRAVSGYVYHLAGREVPAELRKP